MRIVNSILDVITGTGTYFGRNTRLKHQSSTTSRGKVNTDRNIFKQGGLWLNIEKEIRPI